jgi:hypothetical protein
MPPADVKLDVNSVLDISHESLMRVWKRLKDWVDDEKESAKRYCRLAQTSEYYQKSTSGLLQDPELSVHLKWREANKPNADWAKRYDPNFKRAMQFWTKAYQRTKRKLGVNRRKLRRKSAVNRRKLGVNRRKLNTRSGCVGA